MASASAKLALISIPSIFRPICLAFRPLKLLKPLTQVAAVICRLSLLAARSEGLTVLALPLPRHHMLASPLFNSFSTLQTHDARDAGIISIIFSASNHAYAMLDRNCLARYRCQFDISLVDVIFDAA